MPSTHISLNFHFVFSTKNRRRLIADPPRLHEYLGGRVRKAGGVPIEIGGVDDHVHILAGLRATQCVATLLCDIKRASSGWMKELSADFAWQEGYGAFSVSPRDCADVVRYIRGQAEHHRQRTFQEEYRAFLEEHRIEFDERYLW